jgi:hypothetical protein
LEKNCNESGYLTHFAKSATLDDYSEEFDNSLLVEDRDDTADTFYYGNHAVSQSIRTMNNSDIDMWLLTAGNPTSSSPANPAPSASPLEQKDFLPPTSAPPQEDEEDSFGYQEPQETNHVDDDAEVEEEADFQSNTSFFSKVVAKARWWTGF